MKATIWHNPACSTSRKALDLLREHGCEVEVIEYLKKPPSRERLAQLLRDAGLRPAEGLRRRGTDAEDRGLVGAPDAAVLDAMADDPRLIERPLVETAKGVRLARPLERLHEIL